MNIYKKFKNKLGEVIEIVYDGSPQNPLSDDDLFNFYTWERNHVSINENDFKNAEEWYDSIFSEGSFEREMDRCQKEGKSSVGFAYELCKKLNQKGIFALPILKHDHSSVHYYIGDSIDRFDGSIAGFAFAKKEDIYKAYEVKKLTKDLRGKLNVLISNYLDLYTDYANGDVHGFLFRDKDDNLLESCYGFYFAGHIDEYIIRQVLDYIETEDPYFFEV